MKRRAGDMKRRAAISVDALDLRAHLGKRIDDALHWAFLDGSVAGQDRVKWLGGENTGDQARRGAAVAAV